MADSLGYAYVSIPKSSSNAGRPTGKKQYIVLIRVADVKTFTKDAKNVRVTALALVDTAKPVGIYATGSTIKVTETVEGDPDTKGYIHNVAFEHPGNAIDVQEFKEANVNEPMIALVGDCLSDDFDVCGTPEAPLDMSKADGEDSKDKKNTGFEFKTNYRTSPIGKIAKSLIPLTDNTVVNTALGLAAPATGGA